MDLNIPVSNLQGVGPKLQFALTTAGVFTLKDLLEFIPYRYQDASKVTKISELKLKTQYLINAKIDDVNLHLTKRKRMKIISTKVCDDSGCINVIWYNQTYLKNLLIKGQSKYFFGTVAYNWQTRQKILQSPLILNTPQIIPIYSQPRGIKSGFISRIIKNYLNTSDIQETLPKEILTKLNLENYQSALKYVHTPNNISQIESGRKRLEFEELLFLALSFRHNQDSVKNSYKIEIPINLIKEFVDSLPYKLTDGQRKAAWEILNDMGRSKPMQRLLMGEVGSGKTVVGLMATIAVSKYNYQTVWLAPTEVLARQHFESAKKLLSKFKIKIGILTTNTKDADLGNDQLIVGTHALFSKKNKFKNVGLLIVDEQHRFGVEQRKHLTTIQKNVPHFLSMSATPIPRTLALTLYSDLKISQIDELPLKRKKVITKVVNSSHREKVYEFIKKQIKDGRQTFIIVPLIEQTESGNLFGSDKKSIVEEFSNIKENIFQNYKVGLLHGKMNPKDKNLTMQNFTVGKIDILVSTTVVEVGIDIPNATIMVVENAESFGLAQLHQLRGRVGRSDQQSYCFLFTSSESEKAQKRLEALEKYNSGFKLAEIDLQLRGPGSLIGIKQSGLANLKIASLTDTLTLDKVKEALKWFERYPIPEQMEKQISIQSQKNEEKVHLE